MAGGRRDARRRRWSGGVTRFSAPTRRPTVSADLAGDQCRAAARQPRATAGDGRDPNPPPRTRPATDPTRPGSGRQGLLQPRDPHLPAQTPDPGHHPRTRRPEEEPAPPRRQGRAATGVRPRNLQAAQRRRTRHQQAQSPPGGGHPLRQTRLHVPRNHRPRLDQDLAPRPRPMIRGTGSSLVLDSGRSIAEVAKSIGVHEMTLGKWVKKARESGRVPDKELSEPERAELERLRKENATLRMERDFAKKVAAWFAKEQP